MVYISHNKPASGSAGADNPSLCELLPTLLTRPLHPSPLLSPLFLSALSYHMLYLSFLFSILSSSFLACVFPFNISPLYI